MTPASKPSPATAHPQPVGIDPRNRNYFHFRGRTLALISATEHYGSVINRPFDYARYLHDAAERGMTMTRTFLLFRELQSERNPSSPCKPESPDYIAPYPRTGPGRALDGEPVFDLDSWNPEFFARLRGFLTLSSQLGIVVELTLFSNSYHEGVWRLNPLRKDNNLQGIGAGEWQEYLSLGDAPRLARQLAFVRKIVEETAAFDNVIYEICNEPGGGTPGHTTANEVDAWQWAIAQELRAALGRLGGRHLVVGSQSFTYSQKWSALQALDLSFGSAPIDAVNVHPLPDVTFGPRTYQMGEFMSRQLTLTEIRDFCMATHAAGKPRVLDEDNVASIYRDDAGWTIQRKRAWMALICAAHYDYIDFSVTVGSECGTAASQRGIRRAMGVMNQVLHALDLARAQPLPGLVQGVPTGFAAGALGIPGESYLVYLADARELEDAEANRPVSGMALELDLPPGDFTVELILPTTGLGSVIMPLPGRSGPRQARLPAFSADLLLRIARAA